MAYPKQIKWTGRLALLLVLLSELGLVAAGGEDPAALMREAQRAFTAGEERRALQLADRAVQAAPENPDWVQQRGELKFRMGMVRASIEDFDRFLAKVPEREPHHWQRGISCYYAGEYEKGARQFELHRSVNPSDVENAVWHFLCVAKWKGLEEAKAKLIPIEGDGRVPMKQVHALFAGRATPREVLDAAAAGKPSPQSMHQHLFYAHLYLGLYFEAMGDAEKSAEHIRLAVERYPAAHYMGDVARVHLRLRTAKKEEGPANP